MTFEEFKPILAGQFPHLDLGQFQKYQELEGLYEDWNSKINVISRKDIGGLYPHHVLHSLSIAAYLQMERPETFERMQKDGKIKVLDLGTGGGFPGIPLAILFPAVHFTLCDSVGKKTIVAKGVAEAIGLKNTTIVNARAESLDEEFDFVVSRAVTALDNFYPWVKGKYTDSILYLKGGDISEEMQALKTKNKLDEKQIRKWKISNWLTDEYFEDKMVIDISTK